MMPIIRNVSLFIQLLLIGATKLYAQADTAQHITAQRKNSPAQQTKPYVIMISADGFRYDYAVKYHAGHLLALAGNGAAAEYMIPSFPSITFPNHYTLVTGLYPAHHGLIGNKFYDRKLNRFYSYKSNTAAQGIWYGGTPLWVLAEQQHMLSASFYWVGSAAAINNTRPTYYYNYNEQIDIHKRIQAITNWLRLPADKRPHFITVYFPQVDHMGHKKGPDAPETRAAVHFIDSAVYELTKAVAATGVKNVNYIFVSDHGMTQIPTKNPLAIPAAVDTGRFIVSGEGVIRELYAKQGQEQYINSTYQAILKENPATFSAYLKGNMPAHMHYGAADDWHNRLGDIILIPHYPYVFSESEDIDPGCHGYDPYVVKDMMATFYAWGPLIKKGIKVTPFKNVDVFPLVAHLLNLHYTFETDGRKQLIQKIVAHP